MFHPIQISRGASIEILQRSSAPQGRAHFEDRSTVKAAITKPLKKAGIINKSGPKRNRADPVDRLRLVVYELGPVTIPRNFKVVGVSREDAMRSGHFRRLVE